MSTSFPADFLWGAATSAYAIEGSPLADGAGAGIWHRFSHTPGRIASADTGDVAADHYRNRREDVALMRDLGLGAYRFGIAWPRVLPEGTGRVNAPGLDFYQRLVDELLESGIVPFATLMHLDFPDALEDRGGFTNRDSVSWFADYASRVFRVLDDRVPLWATLEDPWSLLDGGYVRGVLAPGRRSVVEAARVAHHLLLAHAAAVEAYRADGRNRIGLLVGLEPKEPASGRHGDLAATTRADAYVNRQFLDPVFLGRHPEEMPEIFGDAWHAASPSDLARIRAPLDFLGVTYATRAITREDKAATPVRASTVEEQARAQSLTDALLWVRERYGSIPLYVAGNGAAFEEGQEDPRRVAYLQEHVEAVARAREAGVDVRGYFVRSLLDGFEGNDGLAKRFGIVHVDFPTGRRTKKASARFYSDMLA